jgi:anthranilate synthase component 1
MNLYINTRTIPADLQTPVAVYLKLRDLYPESALLESSDYHTTQNAMSYVGIAPMASFRVSNGTVTALLPGADNPSVTTATGRQVVDALKRFTSEITPVGGTSPGMLGFTAYDAVKYFEKVEIMPREAKFASIPDICYILFRYIICFDHYKNHITIVEHLTEANAPSDIDSIVAMLHNNNVPQYPFHAHDEPRTVIPDEQYCRMVERGIAHAKRGDVFQVVLSRRFEQHYTGDDFNVYRALRCINPSPYLFYFDFGGFRVFGSSPETHLRVENGTAYIDPIAGTFRRTGDDARDHELAEALLKDEKENAEHIMLVDLARNDLSRSGGHVEIDFLRQIRYYSHVIHMVSRVKATLPAEADVLSLFADTFPAGTLSGAPKVRAMEIINELEPHSRVVYGGCIGQLGFDGSLNQAIIIRSFLSMDGALYSQAGAGIVAQSVPQSELRETVNKLGALAAAVKYAETFNA